MLIIALVALIVFGPRKLPELGRSLGKSIGEFKRASEDFKRTWEREVEVERIERELHIEREVNDALSSLPDGDATSAAPREPARELTHDSSRLAAGQTTETEQANARSPSTESPPPPAASAEATDATVEPAGKQDWL